MLLHHPPLPSAPAAGPRAGADPDDPAGAGPVFLDVTGRRLRRVRLLGAAAAFVVIGYLGLLLSAALGGPTIDAPFLPRPAPNQLLAKPPRLPSTPATHAATGSQAATTRGALAAAATERPSATSAVPHSTANPTSAPTAPVSVTGTPTRGTAPTARPTTVPAATRTTSSPTPPGLTQRATPTKTH